MDERENLLRAVRFERPETIPLEFHINDACWRHYPPEALQELIACHDRLFPGPTVPAPPAAFARDARADQPHIDSWGCRWETREDGIAGTVTRHPLARLAELDRLPRPDPDREDGLGPVDWGQVEAGYKTARARGRLPRGSLRHGHTFLALCDIRGYQDLLFDMMDRSPRLPELIDRVARFNLALVARHLERGAEWVGFPDDLGMQAGPMISPDLFCRYIKPAYQMMMAPVRAAGAVVHMHSDGDIRQLVPDLLACGIEVLNLQDRVNGIDWIREHLAGRVCLELDIDRQEVTRRGTPEEIDRLVRREVELLGSREGGLMLIYGLYPGVPLGNVKALMDAMERYADYHA